MSFLALLFSYRRYREPLFVKRQNSMTRPGFSYVRHANATSSQLVLEIRRFFVSLVLQKDSFTKDQQVVLSDTVLAQNRIVDVGLSLMPYYQVWQDYATDKDNSRSSEMLLSSLRKSWKFCRRT